jgi:hypothetical protein
MKFDAPAFKKLEKVQHLARRVVWKIEPRAPLSPSELLKFSIFSYRGSWTTGSVGMPDQSRAAKLRNMLTTMNKPTITKATPSNL